MKPLHLLMLAAFSAAAAHAIPSRRSLPFQFQFVHTPILLFFLSIKETQAQQCAVRSDLASCEGAGCIWVPGVMGICDEPVTAAPTQKTTATTTVIPRTSSQPQSLFTRNIKLLGEDCALFKWDNNNVWTYAGNTADGRPYYHNVALVALTGIKFGDYYVFYDANCDGKTGAAHSKNGHPQWIISGYKPSLTRLYDLEDDGTCVWDVREAKLPKN